jgi:hypothetical protein
MFRVALALYFFTTTVAGPWLCCCALAAKLDAKGNPAAKTPPIPEGCACCHQSETTAPRPAPVPAAPSPHQKCRCQTDRPPAVLTQPERDTQSASEVLFQALTDLPCFHPSLIASVNRAKDEPGHISSCRSRLTLLHVLRC